MIYQKTVKSSIKFKKQFKSDKNIISMTMKILLLNYEFPPAGGGAGFATYNIGRELVKLGIEVDVLTSRIEGEADGKLTDGMRVYRVTSWRKGIHDCGMVGAYSYVIFALFKRYFLLKKNTYDIEHFFFSLPTGILSQVPLPLKRPPYLVSLRGSDVPGYDPFNVKLEKIHQLLLPLTRRIWSKSKAVVALSQGLKDIAIKTNQNQAISVIPNGIEIDHFKPATEEYQNEANAPLRVITVSRLLERKGIHHLLEAIANPSPLNVELTIVGTGSYQEELKVKCQQFGLDDRVKFIGFVRRDELPALYQSSDLFALPSQTESFGLVFAEAMSCGLPVIATFVGGIPELVRNNKDGILVDAAQPEQVRKALEFMIENPEERKAMGQASRQRVLDKYSWQMIAKQYLEKYQSIQEKN